jgi:hypothetical protein
MGITTLAAWGEFLGGIAVIVSLIYLAGQIRMNTKTVRASNFSEVLTATSVFNTMMVQPDTASLWLSGLNDFEGLSAEDQWRFNALMSQFFGMINQSWQSHQMTLLDDKMFESQANSVSLIFREYPGARQWWAANQDWWPVPFRGYVDGRIREGDATG